MRPVGLTARPDSREAGVTPVQSLNLGAQYLTDSCGSQSTLVQQFLISTNQGRRYASAAQHKVFTQDHPLVIPQTDTPVPAPLVTYLQTGGAIAYSSDLWVTLPQR